MTRNQWLAIWVVVISVWATPLHALSTGDASDHNDRLWRLAVQEQALLNQSGSLLQDATLAGYLQQLTARLWEHVESDFDTPVVEVIMDTRMEAYAYPNGLIVLTTGLLDQIDNEDQLAMILAHEMVHYVRQHAATLYDHFQHAGTSRGLVDDENGQTPGAVDVRWQIDASETQADSEGLMLLKRAGYCDREVLPLMSNLMQRLSSDGAAEALKKIAARRVAMERWIGQDPVHMSSCASTRGDNLEFLLNCIAPTLMANAQFALQHGDWNQAETSVSKFLVLKPEDARAYYIQGEIFRHRDSAKDKGECIGFYEAALRIDPEQPLAHRALGEVYFKAGRYQLARPHFEAFLTLAPQDEAREFIKGYLLKCQN